MGQLGITESLGSWELLFGIAKMRDGGGPDQEKWQLEKSTALKKALLSRKRITRAQVPVQGLRKERQDRFSKTRKRTEKEKGKGNVWRSQNEMTIIQVLSEA